jgi:hypothetical protein
MELMTSIDSLQPLLFVQLQNDVTLQDWQNQLLVSDHDKPVSKPALRLTRLSRWRSVSLVTISSGNKIGRFVRSCNWREPLLYRPTNYSVIEWLGRLGNRTLRGTRSHGRSPGLMRTAWQFRRLGNRTDSEN